MIDEAKIFAKQVLNVFMSPGATELVIFDEKKERLWQTYIFYSERIPELYDYFEDQVFASAEEGTIKEFVKKQAISFPSR